ncbi:hypothetical protein [Bradyrhizobium sp. USDA 4486]
MARLVAFVVLWEIVSALFAQSTSAYDLYNITKREHRVGISGDAPSNVFLGQGLIMDNPASPIPATYSPFAGTGPRAALSDEKAPIDVPTIIHAGTSYVEDVSEYEFASALYANMGGHYGFASFDHAYSYTKNVTTKNDVIIA